MMMMMMMMMMNAAAQKADLQRFLAIPQSILYVSTSIHKMLLFPVVLNMQSSSECLKTAKLNLVQAFLESYCNKTPLFMMFFCVLQPNIYIVLTHCMHKT